MKPIRFKVLGIGAWGPGFENWSELAGIFNGQPISDSVSKGPKPEVIPANERRRAPLPVRLAVESSWQATQQSGLDAAELKSVFVSGIGDTQLTDYMCKVLAGENKALSPTKFHNSVHNAAAGYWTISTGCMQAANSVAGFQQSVPLTLLEGLLQSEVEASPLLLTFYDAPCSDVVHELLENSQSFAASIIICPASVALADAPVLGEFVAEVEQQSSDWAALIAPESIQQCYSCNPSAKILPILQQIASQHTSVEQSLSFPISAGTSLKISKL